MDIHVYVLRVSYMQMINYCYLVLDANTHDAVLIDPAWELHKIEDELKTCNAKLKGILLTHHHMDHVNLAPTLVSKYKIPVYMSKVETNFYHFNAVSIQAIDQFKIFHLGSIAIVPIFTPGHTKGGTSYLIGNNLFSGDTLFIEGCGICTGKGGDAGTMFETLQMLKKIISPKVFIFPGHVYGKPVGQPFQYLLENNIYLTFTNKNDFINFRERPNQKNLFDFK